MINFDPGTKKKKIISAQLEKAIAVGTKKILNALGRRHAK
jgi:hypothetical protein